MKLVFFYDAPGVGRLTTAQALADLTGCSCDIDNSAVSPEDVARRMARHFGLPEAKEGARS